MLTESGQHLLSSCCTLDSILAISLILRIGRCCKAGKCVLGESICPSTDPSCLVPLSALPNFLISRVSVVREPDNMHQTIHLFSAPFLCISLKTQLLKPWQEISSGSYDTYVPCEIQM